MKKYILTTFSNPFPGKEAAYNHWYDNVHCPDLLNIEAFKSAQRFRPETGGNDTGKPYLAVYEIETEDIQSVMQSLQNGSHVIHESDAIDRTSITMVVYEVLGEKQFSGVKKN
jgi:hypothetical protein